ncbi:hypothetical protein EGW38_07790 [Enterococcus faecium]|nr:hypothetical protein EGW09_08235 [Enterococcus faecium]ROX48942.1 hypothetical protein EGW18_08235 [Enterococcus faecium]ROX80270.1 hypothetical protein EGW38_07790 [Enterococcus faecium]ROY30960.1 hypothetical protein EGW50_07795 [Enterococcus faecium]
MFLWLKTLYRKRAVTWPFIFYTIIWTLSKNREQKISFKLFYSYMTYSASSANWLLYSFS